MTLPRKPYLPPNCLARHQRFAELAAHPRRNSQPQTAAHKFNKELDIAGLLIDHGADVNARDSRGCTPLDLAGSRQSMFDFFVEHGAEPGNERKGAEEDSVNGG